MKEKIGMEKLIELLNEYEIEKEKSEGVNVDAYVEFKWDYNYNRLVRYDETDHWEGDNLYGDTAVAYLISKSFGFIKWLVENEKIDTGTRNPLFITELVGEQEKQIPYSFYEEMLIRLALSDTPIEDLISYLK